MNSKPNKKRIYLLLTLLASCLYLQAATYNVRDFGAKADGKTIDSPAINRAIEAAAQDGGGTIYLPAGEYACYSCLLYTSIYLPGGTSISIFKIDEDICIGSLIIEHIAMPRSPNLIFRGRE